MLGIHESDAAKDRQPATWMRTEALLGEEASSCGAGVLMVRRRKSVLSQE